MPAPTPIPTGTGMAAPGTPLAPFQPSTPAFTVPPSPLAPSGSMVPPNTPHTAPLSASSASGPTGMTVDAIRRRQSEIAAQLSAVEQMQAQVTALQQQQQLLQQQGAVPAVWGGSTDTLSIPASPALFAQRSAFSLGAEAGAATQPSVASATMSDAAPASTGLPSLALGAPAIAADAATASAASEGPVAPQTQQQQAQQAARSAAATIAPGSPYLSGIVPQSPYMTLPVAAGSPVAAPSTPLVQPASLSMPVPMGSLLGASALHSASVGQQSSILYHMHPAMATGIPLASTRVAPTCATCGGPSATQCGGCGEAYYCCKECQVAAWPAHKRQCRRADRAGDEDVDSDDDARASDASSVEARRKHRRSKEDKRASTVSSAKKQSKTKESEDDDLSWLQASEEAMRRRAEQEAQASAGLRRRRRGAGDPYSSDESDTSSEEEGAERAGAAAAAPDARPAADAAGAAQPGAPAANVNAAGANNRGLRRFVDLGLLVRLCIVMLVFFYGGPQERFNTALGVLSVYYLFSVGLMQVILSTLLKILSCLFCCGLCCRSRPARPAINVNAAAGGAAAAGEAGNAGPQVGAGARRPPAQPENREADPIGDLVRFYTRLLVFGRGFFVMDLCAAFLSFLVSLWPQWQPDALDEFVAQQPENNGQQQGHAAR